MAKFKTGDKVEIVIGNPMWINDGGKVEWFDGAPWKVGKKDIIEQVTKVQGKSEYSLVKHGAWFTDSQLKMVKANPNK